MKIIPRSVVANRSLIGFRLEGEPEFPRSPSNSRSTPSGSVRSGRRPASRRRGSWPQARPAIFEQVVMSGRRTAWKMIWTVA